MREPGIVPARHPIALAGCELDLPLEAGAAGDHIIGEWASGNDILHDCARLPVIHQQPRPGQPRAGKEGDLNREGQALAQPARHLE
jgi:hypothetical protein